MITTLTAINRMFRPVAFGCRPLLLYVLITYPQPGPAAEAGAGRLPKFHITQAAGVEALVQQAITLTIAQKYAPALALADSAIKLAPEEPVGYFFHAAILQARMLDYEKGMDEKTFLNATGACRKVAQKKLRQNPKDAWACFFLGSALGYEAFFLGKKRRFFEAFRTGMQSINYLEAALKLDPQLYDAYLGIGTYKYYRSKMSKNFTWLPFVNDERAEGIRMIRQAIAHGRYSRSAAINGLSWVLMDENRPEEALAIVDSALALYPGSRFFLWSAGEAAYRTGRYGQAAAVYKELLQSLQNENVLSPYLELVGRTRLAKVYQAANQMEASCEELQRLEALELSNDDRERGEAFIKEAAGYRKNCGGGLAGESANGTNRRAKQ
jgi:tetratricopeptide (TPR) repeat protein